MYLLDTCALIWMLSSPKDLSVNARTVFFSSKEIYISFASLWEIAIKQGNGKLNLQKSIHEIAKTCESPSIHILIIITLINRLIFYFMPLMVKFISCYRRLKSARERVDRHLDYQWLDLLIKSLLNTRRITVIF